VARDNSKPVRIAAASFRQCEHPIGIDGLTFSPTTSALIYLEREVVLVDAQFIKNDHPYHHGSGRLPSHHGG
jgi:hypothetical protein